MSLYLDKKFVSLISPKLERFKQKSEYLWNFRCPFCGDSKKNKIKARGYFYRQKSNIFYTCHNCHASISFGNFVKAIDLSLYREYQLERYKNESSSNVAKPDFSFVKEKPDFSIKRISIPTIESLPNNHVAKKYIVNRKIPKNCFSEIYYTENFRDFVLDMIPDCEKDIYPEPRIIIPFYDKNKNLLGFQGRAIGDSKIKYITIKLDENNSKIFGLDKVDLTKKIYVVEGPIDSLFLQNSIAMMDAALYNAVPYLGNYDYVFIYDNEPRNKEIIRHMNKTISMQKNICIWPENVAEKDINDMIIKGATPSEIQNIIDRNTFNNLRAKLEFERWKRM